MDPGLSSLVLLFLGAGFAVLTTARLAKAVHRTAIVVLCGARVSFFGRDLLS
jgi:hypothetical protein